ncbi:hypothetical protein RM704_01715 [Streptomyces sp. DSM 3412]|uniref:Uncharacterized protein n=1 Tax=Streptomyces gottesmaniae TaxID=3075518 RepID=A0ABU2YPI8_9ACTN|nr:hypothetical protein [Streptomyces sp. DSM 3412]MDT0566210.1 hypothetical protein [Streptomyces sp. DSM 3412]
MLTLVGGQVFHNVRWVDGSWNGAQLADGSGAIDTIAAAVTPQR